MTEEQYAEILEIGFRDTLDSVLASYYKTVIEPMKDIEDYLKYVLAAELRMTKDIYSAEIPNFVSTFMEGMRMFSVEDYFSSSPYGTTLVMTMFADTVRGSLEEITEKTLSKYK